MTKDIQKTALRLPRELHTAILDAASKSGRTMNAEIVYRLQKSIENEDPQVVGVKHIDLRIRKENARYPLTLFNAINEMEEIILNTKKMLEEAKTAEDGESNEE